MSCAIDFGTSNSGIAHVEPDGAVRLLELEPGRPTLPTAVFYAVEGLAPHEPPQRLYGSAAIAAYVEGTEGRLMRSMKSILGSSLADRHTDLGGGHSVAYLDVVAGYLRQLKQRAEAAARDDAPLTQVVLGRPVFFVDDDPARDARAQAALEAAARAVGFTDVRFQYEPIAAALDYEQARAVREQRVLVADIGGGTSDFSLVRVGPQRSARLERRDDILANHGVHAAGTDFDRHLELACILPTCGYRSLGPAKPGQRAREVPNAVYFDLATWHLINTVYTPQRASELASLRDFYADAQLYRRLLRVVSQRLGHALAAQAEQAKIELSDAASTRVALDAIEPGLAVELTHGQALAAVGADLDRIVAAARETLRQAGVAASAVDVLYLTGGSTGLAPLAQRLAAVCPAAQVVRGDRFASVLQGLGLHAQRSFNAPTEPA